MLFLHVSLKVTEQAIKIFILVGFLMQRRVPSCHVVLGAGGGVREWWGAWH